MNLTKTINYPLITLIGPPNSGKTTLFNHLSGSSHKTVNYPGATVEYSVGKFQEKYELKAQIIDSPGIVSLISHSPDEEVAINSLFSNEKFGKSDLVIVTVDSSQLSRHLLLVKQLSECNFNMIIALTMIDILNRKGFDVDEKKLGNLFGCDAVKIEGRTGIGIKELILKIDENLKSNNGKPEKRINLINNNHDALIETFKQIEQIENEILLPAKQSSELPNVYEANKQLKMLVDIGKKAECHKIDTRTLKIDKILLHPTWGLAIFFLVMGLIFTSIFWLAEPLISLVDNFFGLISNETLKLLGYNWLGDLIANGLISGTGAILVFVPQIIILFLILGTLEDTGYLARGAMLIDKPLSKIGLNGKSFVPMLSGFACAIPAILATRTIPNRRERLLTIFIIPLMSCSARLPVYALLLAFLLPPESAWLGGFLLAAIYLFGTLSSIIIASIVNKFKNKFLKANDNSSFILELPAYRAPKFRVVMNNARASTFTYLKKAGPVIFILSLVLWLLTTFPNVNPQVNLAGFSEEQSLTVIKAERLSTSYAADLGKLLQPAMAPLGLDWRVGVALISAFAAREVFVSSLALIFKVTSYENTLQNSIVSAMRQAKINGSDKHLFTTSTVTGLIIFFIFAMQCLSTIAVSKKESGGWRIPIFQIIIFSSIAYISAFAVVNVLRLFGIN